MLKSNPESKRIALKWINIKHSKMIVKKTRKSKKDLESSVKLTANDYALKA